jgi:hypothetical protein
MTPFGDHDPYPPASDAGLHGDEPSWSDCDRYEPRPWWAAAESWRTDRGRLHNRLTHQVLLDGRLIETWSEPVEDTPWQRVAKQLDDQQKQARPAPEPLPLPHDNALDWLDSLVGGRKALDALTDAPLSLPDVLSVDGLPLAAVHRVEGVSRALDELTGLFDAETGRALKHVLAALWSEDRELVLNAKSSAQVAGGICWLVGKANDSFGKDKVSQLTAQKKIGLTTSISSFGSSVHRTLRGLQPTYADRPWSQRDLLATGRAGFLTSTTRRRLIRLRDQAMAAREAWLADEEHKAAAQAGSRNPSATSSRTAGA